MQARRFPPIKKNKQHPKLINLCPVSPNRRPLRERRSEYEAINHTAPHLWREIIIARSESIL
jgi:hypothetical protein